MRRLQHAQRCCVLCCAEPSNCNSFQSDADKAVMCRRSDGILHEVLVKAAALPLARRPTLALVLAALLASFARQAADQAVLATMQSAALIESIILVRVRIRAKAGSGHFRVGVGVRTGSGTCSA